MENQVIEALQTGLKEIEAKHSAQVAQLNEDFAKKNASLVELKEQVNGLIKANGNLKAETVRSFSGSRFDFMKNELVISSFRLIFNPFQAISNGNILHFLIRICKGFFYNIESKAAS
jgi:hypothetical protein